MPISMEIPHHERRCCALPSGGARLSICSSVLPGPLNCNQLRAVTCGGIIMGSIIMNTQNPFARISVSTTNSASVVPSSTDSNVARPAVSKLLPVARQVDA